jgi:hypothetical protein
MTNCLRDGDLTAIVERDDEMEVNDLRGQGGILSR